MPIKAIIVVIVFVAIINFFMYKFLEVTIIKNFIKIKSLIIVICLLIFCCSATYLLSFIIKTIELNTKIYNILSLIFALNCFFMIFYFIYLFCNFFLNLSIKTQTIDINRRKFIKFCFDIGFFIFTVSCFLKNFLTITKYIDIKKVNVKLKNLKNPVNFAVITDVHLGFYLDDNFLKKILKKIDDYEENIEALLIVGDLLDIPSKQAHKFLYPFKDFKKPIFFVTGNHEFYQDIDEILKILPDFNIKVLENENVFISGINLAGVHDLFGDKYGKFQPNLQNALKNRIQNHPTVLLAHQPKFVNNFLKDTNEVDLAICGHTHAGQIFPFSILVWLEQKFVHGLYKLNNLQIYVSSGVGFWGPPIRFLTKSEIVILKLHQ